MSIFDQISEDIKAAMLARDKVHLEALRSVKKEFLEAKTAKGSNGELSDEQALKIMQKLVKQRKDSADIYTQNARPEMAEAEMAEAQVIEQYLPQPLSEEELKKEIEKAKEELGINDPKMMGKLIGYLQKTLAGKVEGRKLAEMVKAALA